MRYKRINNMYVKGNKLKKGKKETMTMNKKLMKSEESRIFGKRCKLNTNKRNVKCTEVMYEVKRQRI